MSDAYQAAKEPERFRAAVSGLVEAARNEAGNAEALAARLQDLGIVRDQGKRYSVSAISNWVQGRTMPPGDVLLAVAYVGGQSIDAKILGTAETTAEAAAADGQLKAELARLQAEVMHLYSRMGEPYERATDSPSAPNTSQRTGTDDR